MQAAGTYVSVGLGPLCCRHSPSVPATARLAIALRAPLAGTFQTQHRVRSLAVRPVAASGPRVQVAAVESKPAEAVAHLKKTRGSAHKLRRVLDQIRGRTYEDALMILEFMPYRACEPILQTLISAASNAKNNQGMSKTKLFISECYADEAGNLKRFRPRAKGRPFQILKPTSHLTIKVQEKA